MKFILFIFLVIFNNYCNGYTVNDFSGGAFSIKPKDGLYEIDIGMDDLKGGDVLMSFGDFNGDTMNDLVTASNDFKSVKIYHWSGASYSLSNTIILKEKVISVIPVDFNHDGSLDLLIITDPETDVYIMNLYHQTRDPPGFGNEKSEPHFTKEIAKFQPFIVDIDGDHKTDVFYLKKEDNSRMILTLIEDEQSEEDDKEIFANVPFQNYVSDAEGCFSYETISKNIFTTPHYNSFVDLNGDCRADIFITSTDKTTNLFEFWIKQDDGRFCLVNPDKYTAPEGLKGVGFSDLDFDGGIDMIVAYEANGLHLELNYNNNPRGTGSMCSINTDRQTYNPFHESKHENVILYKVMAEHNSNLKIYSLSENIPGMLRFGDIDADTYPDLLISLYDPNFPNTSQTYLLKNEDCGNNEFCSGKSHKRFLHFNKDSSYNFILLRNSSVYGSFVDIGEMGILDIMLVTRDKDNFKVKAIFNYLNADTFFLKALGLNGFKVGSTGGIYYGSTFQCVITTLDGDQRLSNNVQLYQSAHNALQLPYVFIGLGRTNNYVENFYIGMPQNSSHSKSWTPIIPNSQLIIYPTGSNPDDWTIDIYVNPTKATIIVVISTASILLIIGIAILYLHRKEKEEDKNTQEKFLTFFR